MDYLQNHIWCSDSNWGGQYDCRHLVGIESYGDDKDDWSNLIETSEVDRRRTISFRPHVLKWLEENVADRKDPECVKGWCVGSTEYMNTNPTNATVFFHRRKDAMAFIRTFSKYKKPVFYCQYFSDVRKRLNLETMKYETL